MQLRGVGLHEDTAAQGFAVDNAFRRWLVDRAKELGATMLRTHYPMHPYIHELADREGLLIWSEIPVYAHKSSLIDDITPRAIAELRDNIETNGSHPSVLIWSIANELSSKPGPDPGHLHPPRRARRARELDPTRPVGLAVAGYPGAGCQARYRPLDVIGVNDYFGWYPGPQGALFDRDKLSPYLDSLRRCYPNDALMVTEFGAEANRDGSVEDKGTYAFQQDFVELPPGRVRDQAVAERRAVLGDQRVPRAAGVGRRQPAPDAADPPEGAAALRRHAEARVDRRPALVPGHAAVPLDSPASRRRRPPGRGRGRRPWRRCG